MDTLEAIQERCAQEYGITREQLLSKCRKRRFVNARHLAIYIAKEQSDLTNEQLAGQFNRDEDTSISRAVKKVGFLMGVGKGFSREYRKVVADLPISNGHSA